jgi:hypothetical protein
MPYYIPWIQEFVIHQVGLSGRAHITEGFLPNWAWKPTVFRCFEEFFRSYRKLSRWELKLDNDRFLPHSSILLFTVQGIIPRPVI